MQCLISWLYISYINTSMPIFDLVTLYILSGGLVLGVCHIVVHTLSYEYCMFWNEIWGIWGKSTP